MHSNYATTFYAKILAGAVTKGMIRVFMSRYNAQLRGADIFTVSPEEVKSLIDAVEKIEPRCTPEHEASGFAFLYNKLLTPNGNLRQTQDAKEFRPNDALFLQMVKQRDAFEIRWVGVRYIDQGSVRYAPIYRLTALFERALPGSVQWLEYCATSWQSGGWFEVVDRGLSA